MHPRYQWPAAFFCLTLLISVPVAVVSTGPGWCDRDELPVVCTRNWFNAAGNILTVIVAVAAAGLAYSQVLAARRQADIAKHQADMARIPLMREQLSHLHTIEQVALRFQSDLRAISKCCNFMLNALWKDLPDQFDSAWNACFEQSNSLGDMLDQLETLAMKLSNDARLAGLIARTIAPVFDVFRSSYPVAKGAALHRLGEADRSTEAVAQYFKIMKDDSSEIQAVQRSIERAVPQVDQVRKMINELRWHLIDQIEKIESWELGHQ